MRIDAASLVQFAAARGIDLPYVAGASSNLDGIARQRARTEIEREMGIDVQQTARGRGTRVTRAGLGIAELGQAAAGLGVIPWSAALYSFAGNTNGYWVLWSALAKEAGHLGRREQWPMQVRAENGELSFYRERLAQLVLDEDRSKHLFAAAPALFAACMGVAPATWDGQLRDPFRSLQAVYQRWLRIASGAIGRAVRRED